MKIIRFSVLTIMMLLTLNFFAIHANAQSISVTNSSVYLNGVKQDFSTPTISYNDRTMLPMRELFEKLGASVEWDETTQKITASTKTKKLIMTINSTVVNANDFAMLMMHHPFYIKIRQWFRLDS